MYDNIDNIALFKKKSYAYNKLLLQREHFVHAVRTITTSISRIEKKS